MSDQFYKIGASSRIKTLPSHRIVFGWASVSKTLKGNSWEKFYDLGYTGADGIHYRDHVTEEAILTSSLRYMKGERVAGEAHKSAAFSHLENAVEGISDPGERAAALEILKNAKRASRPPAIFDDPELTKHNPDLFGKVKKRGEVVYAFPLLSDIMAPLGVKSDRSGLLVGIQTDEEMFQAYQNGDLNQLSIGGRRIVDTVVGEA